MVSVQLSSISVLHHVQELSVQNVCEKVKARARLRNTQSSQRHHCSRMWYIHAPFVYAMAQLEFG